MELETVVEAHGRELAEVRHVDGRALTVELDLDRALGRLDHGALITDDLILGRVKLFLETEHGTTFLMLICSILEL